MHCASLCFVATFLVAYGSRIRVLPHGILPARSPQAMQSLARTPSGNSGGTIGVLKTVGATLEAQQTFAASGRYTEMPHDVSTRAEDWRHVESALMEVLGCISSSHTGLEACDVATLGLRVASIVDFLYATRPSRYNFDKNKIDGQWSVEYSDEIPLVVRSELTQHVEDVLKDISVSQSINDSTIITTAIFSLQDRKEKVATVTHRFAQLGNSQRFAVGGLDNDGGTSEVMYLSDALLVLRRNAEEGDMLGQDLGSKQQRGIEIWKRVREANSARALGERPSRLFRSWRLASMLPLREAHTPRATVKFRELAKTNASVLERSTPSIEGSKHVTGDDGRELMRTMMTDPQVLEHAKRFQRQLETLLGHPSLVKQAGLVKEQMEAIAAIPNLSKHAKEMIAEFESLQADPGESARWERIFERLSVLMEHPEVQLQSKLLAEQVEKMYADPLVQEQLVHIMELLDAMSADSVFRDYAQRLARIVEHMVAEKSDREEAEKMKADQAVPEAAARVNEIPSVRPLADDPRHHTSMSRREVPEALGAEPEGHLRHNAIEPTGPQSVDVPVVIFNPLGLRTNFIAGDLHHMGLKASGRRGHRTPALRVRDQDAAEAEMSSAISTDRLGYFAYDTVSGFAKNLAPLPKDEAGESKVKWSLKQMQRDTTILDKLIAETPQLVPGEIALLASTILVSIFSPYVLAAPVVEVLVPFVTTVTAAVGISAEYTGKVAVARGKEIAAATLQVAAEAEIKLAQAERAKAIIPLAVGVSASAAAFALVAPALVGDLSVGGTPVGLGILLLSPLFSIFSAAVAALAARECNSLSEIAIGIGGRRFAQASSISTTYVSVTEQIQRSTIRTREKWFQFALSVLPAPLLGALVPGTLPFKGVVAAAVGAAQAAFSLANAEYLLSMAQESVAFKSRTASIADTYANQGARAGSILPFTSACSGLCAATTVAIVEVLPLIPSTLGESLVCSIFPSLAALIAASASISKARCEIDSTAAATAADSFMRSDVLSNQTDPFSRTLELTRYTVRNLGKQIKRWIMGPGAAKASIVRDRWKRFVRRYKREEGLK